MKKDSKQQEYLTSEESFNDGSNKNITNIKGSMDNVKTALSLDLKYDDLKFSKSISSKIGITNKNSNTNINNIGIDQNSANALSNMNSNRVKSSGTSQSISNSKLLNQQINLRDKSKDSTYSDMVIL